MVMMMASTPSLNASKRLVPTIAPLSIDLTNRALRVGLRRLVYWACTNESKIWAVKQCVTMSYEAIQIDTDVAIKVWNFATHLDAHNACEQVLKQQEYLSQITKRPVNHLQAALIGFT